MEKKVKIGIETSGDAKGLDAVRQKLEALEKQASETSSSFEGLATAEFGDLSSTFEQFGEQITRAREQLDGIGAEGVDVSFQTGQLDKLESDLQSLRAEVSLEVDSSKVDAAKNSVSKLPAKVDVDDSALDATRQKVDGLADVPTTRPEVDASEVEDTARKLNELTGAQVVEFDVQSGNLDQTIGKLSTLDQDTVTVDVEADIKKLEDASRALAGITDKEVAVDARTQAALREIAELGNSLDRVKSKADASLALETDDAELRQLGKSLLALDGQLDNVGKGSKEFDRLQRGIRATRAEIQRTAQARGLTATGTDAAKASKEVERLTAKFSTLRNSVANLAPGSDGFSRVSQSLQTLRGEISKVQETSEGAGESVGKLATVSASLGSKVGVAAAGFATLTGALSAFTAGISKASEQQDLEVQLTTLLGSAEAAQGRISELRDFAAKTPFELPGLTRASRILETLTDGALSTGDGLRLVGDLASGTGESFENLAVHIGRVYDGLQNGQAVGESLLRLQELGIITAETRTEIERLQEANQKGDEVFAVAAKDFERFGGAMEAQSKTLSGVFSTLKDNFNQLLIILSKPALAPLTGTLKALIPVVQVSTQAITRLFQVFGFLGVEAGKSGEKVSDAYAKIREKSDQSGKAAVESAKAQTDALAATGEELGNVLAKLSEITKANEDYANAVKDRKVAEIQASDLSAEEKRVAIFQIEEKSQASRLAAQEKELQNQRLLAAEALQTQTNFQNIVLANRELERQKNAELDQELAIREKLEESIQAQSDAIQKEETRLEEVKLDRDRLQVAKGLTGTSLASFKNPFQDQIKSIEDNLAKRQVAIAGDRGILSGRESEFSSEALAESIAESNEELDSLNASVRSYAERIRIATEAQQRVDVETDQKSRQLQRVAAQTSAARQVGFGGETSAAGIANAETSATAKADQLAKALGDLDGALGTTLGGLSDLAAGRPGAGTKPKSGSIRADLDVVGKSLEDGASKGELESLKELISRIRNATENKEAKEAIQSLTDTLKERATVSEQLEVVQSEIDELRQESPSAADRISGKVSGELGRAIALGERAQAQLLDSGDSSSAAQLRGVVDSLRDGATQKELVSLGSMLRQVDTTQSAAIRETVAALSTSANSIAALSQEVARIQQQLKNNRL